MSSAADFGLEAICQTRGVSASASHQSAGGRHSPRAGRGQGDVLQDVRAGRWQLLGAARLHVTADGPDRLSVARSTVHGSSQR
jgi:hypothetical protein